MEDRNLLRPSLAHRFGTIFGLACLGVTLLLSPAGVRVVHAEDGKEVLMSVDPALVAAAAVAPPAAPLAVPADASPTATTPVEKQVREDVRPGQPSVEISPGVVVFNTRGYNYGPPTGEIDATAARYERAGSR